MTTKIRTLPLLLLRSSFGLNQLNNGDTPECTILIPWLAGVEAVLSASGAQLAQGEGEGEGGGQGEAEPGHDDEGRAEPRPVDLVLRGGGPGPGTRVIAAAGRAQST